MFRKSKLYPWLSQVRIPEIELQMLTGFSKSARWVSEASASMDLPLDRVQVKYPEQRYILRIPGGAICGEHGFVLTSDHCLLTEPRMLRRTSVVQQLANTALQRLQEGEVEVRYLPGKVVTIASDWSDCYFHWMLEILPRLKLIQAAGIEFDTLVTSPLNEFYQLESLETLGFDLSRIVQCRPDSLIRTEQLIVPSFVRRPLEPDLMEWLAEVFPSSKIPKRRLYLSREGASERRVVNEPALLPILDEFGFEVVRPETMTLKEQADLMGQAAILMGPHGSGLTNLIHCPSQALLIEIFNPLFKFPYYRQMARDRGMHYQSFIGAVSEDSVWDNSLERHPMRTHIEIPLQAFRTFLSSLNI